METKLQIVLLAAFFQLTVFYTTSVTSVCCHPHQKPSKTSPTLVVGPLYCDDDTRGTPFCGYGKCNLAGCSCKGGCRTASSRSEGEESSNTVQEAFQMIDANSDGYIQESELQSYLERSSDEDTTSLRSALMGYDADQDGKLNENEFLDAAVAEPAD